MPAPGNRVETRSVVAARWASTAHLPVTCIADGCTNAGVPFRFLRPVSLWRRIVETFRTPSASAAKRQPATSERRAGVSVAAVDADDWLHFSRENGQFQRGGSLLAIRSARSHALLGAKRSVRSETRGRKILTQAKLELAKWENLARRVKSVWI